MKNYDYVIVGAGIAGCATAYFLTQNKETNVLIVDKLEDTAMNASSTAGGFLSPLLGKPNSFKDLVTTALNFSTNFYKEHFPEFFIQNGVIRIPKDEEDEAKFESYKPFMDFDYEVKEQGCFFPIGGQVHTQNLCQKLIEKCEKLFNYKIKHIIKDEDFYILNNEIKAKNLILTTGADISLIEEKYFNIRAVWGQRIDIETKSCIGVNYHKACSISTSRSLSNSSNYLVSIGATHHRFNGKNELQQACLDNPTLENFKKLSSDDNIINTNTKELLTKANDITPIEPLKILKERIGARASSVDYFPMVGELINSNETLNMFPYIKNGTHVQSERLIHNKNLYVLNGLGGRGFVLGPYLAHELVEHIINKKPLIQEVTTERLFRRWAKRAN